MLLKSCQRKNILKAPLFAYGTEKKTHLLIGMQDCLRLGPFSSSDDFWAQVQIFLLRHRHDYVGGFIGFNPCELSGNQPHLINNLFACHLFVPECVLESSECELRVLKGHLEIPSFAPEEIQSLSQPSSRIDIARIDNAPGHAKYLESVDAILSSIKMGEIVRATLARKVISPKPLDLLQTFLADHSQHRLARNFFFSNSIIAFAGQCPELLAEGVPDDFSAHKLSGTYPILSPQCGQNLLADFKADERIIREHCSGTLSIAAALDSIANVQREQFQIMQLPSLLHGWSEFRCQLKDQIDISKVLRAVFPYGAFPVEKGLALIAKYEDFRRGPYYGITGLIQPGLEFSFTQILRSVFRNKSSSYLVVGAAITKDSTPEIELQETIGKLNSIHAFGANFTSDFFA